MKTKNLTQSRKRKKTLDTIGTVVVWIFVVLALFPIAWMAITSLMTQGDIATGKIGSPTNFGNYKEMWESVDFFTYFRNSVIVCSITTIIALFIATFAGYATARFMQRNGNYREEAPNIVNTPHIDKT